MQKFGGPIKSSNYSPYPLSDFSGVFDALARAGTFQVDDVVCNSLWSKPDETNGILLVPGRIVEIGLRKHYNFPSVYLSSSTVRKCQ